MSPLEKLKYCDCKTGHITKGMSNKETWYDAYDWLIIKENIWELPWSFDWSYNNNHISKQKPLKLTMGQVCKFYWKGQLYIYIYIYSTIWGFQKLLGGGGLGPPSLCVPPPLVWPINDCTFGEKNVRRKLKRKKMV